ncbi:Retrovirus-related Pol polyprotein [Stylophora pistillata]|uniref:Retrovirus-related Pol polyprotein n=1 Tax=Stylophora pistillata TaxID=50429 RepID=A0A2B4RFZ4_STYPI|nr:Retrovirus-related Pol polyprotein [Stylophora pistillata]
MGGKTERLSDRCSGIWKILPLERLTVDTARVTKQVAKTALKRPLATKWLRKKVEVVQSHKLLGVLIQDDLKWRSHILSLTKKATQRLYIIRVLRRNDLPPKDLLSVYTALIRSVLEYACPTRLPFGVAASPAIFQQTMDSTLSGINGVGSILYDLIVTGPNDNENLRNLENTVKRLDSMGVKLKKSKCVFMKPSVEYFAFVVDRHGIHPSPRDGEEKPVAYASRSLSASEQNYSMIEKEALAIVFGIKKFHQYLFGRRFSLLTDHRPLTFLLGPKRGIPVLAASRLQRWAIQLSAYQYDIEYRASKDHANADALSRLPRRTVEEPNDWSIEADQVNRVQMQRAPVTVS